MATEIRIEEFKSVVMLTLRGGRRAVQGVGEGVAGEQWWGHGSLCPALVGLMDQLKFTFWFQPLVKRKLTAD
jgi:hypothetical protein